MRTYATRTNRSPHMRQSLILSLAAVIALTCPWSWSADPAPDPAAGGTATGSPSPAPNPVPIAANQPITAKRENMVDLIGEDAESVLAAKRDESLTDAVDAADKPATTAGEPPWAHAIVRSILLLGDGLSAIADKVDKLHDMVADIPRFDATALVPGEIMHTAELPDLATPIAALGDQVAAIQAHLAQVLPLPPAPPAAAEPDPEPTPAPQTFAVH